MSTNHLSAFTVLASLALAAGCSSGGTTTPATPTTPAVVITPAFYTETNATTGNSVVAYSRASSGALTSIGTYATGANGVGLPTAVGALPFPIGGATGAVQLSPSGSYLYAVDAGSADVAAFSVAPTGALTLIALYPTGGTSPGSITIDSTGKYLYVLNTGSVSDGKNTGGSITGFSIGSTGTLAPLTGSTQNLSSTTYVDPSQVSFSPDGTYLVATEKATGMIDIYPVTVGVAGKPLSFASAGSIPFGFAFTAAGNLVVSNAESTTIPNTGTVSSYSTKSGGPLTVVSSRVADLQSAPCWIAITSTGTFAYVTNTISGSVSGYSIGTSTPGTLTLLTAGGITAAQPNTTGPIDLGVAPGNGFLYVLNSNAGASPGTIAGFSIATSGALTPITTGVSGLAPGSIGMAMR